VSYDFGDGPVTLVLSDAYDPDNDLLTLRRDCVTGNIWAETLSEGSSHESEALAVYTSAGELLGHLYWDNDKSAVETSRGGPEGDRFFVVTVPEPSGYTATITDLTASAIYFESVGLPLLVLPETR